MDKIQHKFIQIGSLNLHVAEIGTGNKAVLFLHGFPEIWYSWRYQMIALSESGFRVIAPDYRGFGLSEVPHEPETALTMDIISDLVGILDFLDISKVVVVGKDYGVRPAYTLPLLYPERILGVVTMGAPFIPPGSIHFADQLPEGFYMSRWREPGRAEADFGRFDAKDVVKNIYIQFSRSELPIAGENQEVLDLVDPNTRLPYWFTEKDVEEYGALYRKSGFQTALQVVYRSFSELFDVKEPLVKVPALLIVGGKDYFLKFPGIEEYIKSEKAKEFVPNLETIHLPEGSHFVQEQLPDEVNQLLITFLNTRIWS